MNWFFIAIGAPFLFALVNISDQYLVSKYSTGERGVGGLVLFSSLIGIFTAILISIFTNNFLGIPLLDKLLLALTGLITIVWVVLYFFALEIEDVSTVAAWFLTIPVFGYIIGYVFLNEALTTQQLVGSIVVLLGVTLISIDFSNRGQFKLKWLPSLYMFIACILYAIIGIIFKYVTVEGNFWASSFTI